MTLRFTRGALIIILALLAAAVGWSFHAYQHRKLLERHGLAALEKTKAGQLAHQIAEARGDLKRSPDARVDPAKKKLIATQLAGLVSLAQQSSRIAIAAREQARGSFWIGAGFLLMSLIVLLLLLQTARARGQKRPIDLELLGAEWTAGKAAWQDLGAAAGSGSAAKAYARWLQLAAEVYTPTAQPPHELGQRLAAEIEEAGKLPRGDRRKLLHLPPEYKEDGLAAKAVQLAWRALLLGEKFGLAGVELQDLAMAAFFYELGSVSPNGGSGPAHVRSAQLLNRISDLDAAVRGRLQAILLNPNGSPEANQAGSVLSYCLARQNLFARQA
jgi:hypothetical protein